MSTSTNEHAWIYEKPSWIVCIYPSRLCGFEPTDPASGRWSPDEISAVVGPGAQQLVVLQGKWEGEVLIARAADSNPDEPINRMACELIKQSLGSGPVLRGQVLMTLCSLVEECVFGSGGGSRGKIPPA